MEKAILKTLCYSDLFDYPLKSWEIHKWLISKKVDLKSLDKPLKSLLRKGIIETKSDYFFLKGRSHLVKKRVGRAAISQKFLRKGILVSQLFRIVPWVKMVGISGSLAMENASKTDDIDLFVVTDSKRLWLSRLLILIILSAFGLRRKRREKRQNISGKICLNILLDTVSLGQYKSNIYIAHEVLQLKLLWQRGHTYQKYLEDNYKIFKYLPNWIASNRNNHRDLSINKKKQDYKSQKLSFKIFQNINLLFDQLELFAKFIQKKYMGQVFGLERISDSALYFHPNDYNEIVLSKYKKLLKSYDI